VKDFALELPAIFCNRTNFGNRTPLLAQRKIPLDKLLLDADTSVPQLKIDIIHGARQLRTTISGDTRTCDIAASATVH
jgi:hypothetical protein